MYKIPGIVPRLARVPRPKHVRRSQLQPMGCDDKTKLVTAFRAFEHANRLPTLCNCAIGRFDRPCHGRVLVVTCAPPSLYCWPKTSSINCIKLNDVQAAAIGKEGDRVIVSLAVTRQHVPFVALPPQRRRAQ